jgi:hypothetical protein
MPRLTWKREPVERGLAAVAQGPLGYELNFGPHKSIASVNAKSTGFHRYQGWYWVAGANPDLGIAYRNTSATPKATIEEAKDEAEGYVRAALRAKGLVK